MQIYGHRGASTTAPENTLAAFREAWEQGADGVELDVHLTSDRRVLVCHDADTRRTTGKRVVIAKSAAASLQKLDAGAWKARRWAGERLPLLEDVLAELPADKRLLVEIKCGPDIARVLGKLPLDEGRVGFLCFDAKTLAAVRRALPLHACLLNVAPPKPRESHDTDALIALAHRRGFSGLSFGWYPGLPIEVVATIHDAGLDVAVWGLPSMRAAQLARDAGADILIVDRPGPVRQGLARG